MNHRTFPTTRLRRLRAGAFSRHLTRETRLSPYDLIYPIFLQEGNHQKTAVGSMPGVFRHSLDLAVKLAKEAHQLGIQAIALFPIIDEKLKSPTGEQAFHPDGLVPRAIKAFKSACPDLGLITDIALDPYTSHGQDGIIDDSGYVLNDRTIETLVQQALCHARAGADVVAPSDMMDGRIGAIRKALEAEGHVNTIILSYAVKYASTFYGPFRDAVDSKGKLGKQTKDHYQMDPANSNEALQEALLDLEEGADILMVKPGMFYLDVIKRIKESFQVPTFAYQVSGEYAMFKAAAEKGWIDEKSAVLEAMLCFKRAGADAVLSYYALDIARWLNEN